MQLPGPIARSQINEHRRHALLQIPQMAFAEAIAVDLFGTMHAMHFIRG
jgi:hypothetical protein